jgi:hypothetical protein
MSMSKTEHNSISYVVSNWRIIVRDYFQTATAPEYWKKDGTQKVLSWCWGTKKVLNRYRGYEKVLVALPVTFRWCAQSSVHKRMVTQDRWTVEPWQCSIVQCTIGSNIYCNFQYFSRMLSHHQSVSELCIPSASRSHLRPLPHPLPSGPM